ncbi:sigma 54-interacting transcriptional regulator [bacterium]|nr:sigma 54-interacting transcriptional regulator [bacterium]MBU1073628.1 sigma 54-interacting transcriptional regulator [bacterium]MBU1676069.1 sigma 54-interacting transcriptional regulator [bacterium]
MKGCMDYDARARRGREGALDQDLLDRARLLYRQERFEESLAVCRRAVGETEDGAIVVVGGAPCVLKRDAVVLAAWCLYDLRRFEACRSWLFKAQDRGWLSSGDVEAAVVTMWIHNCEGRYEAVIDEVGRLLDRADPTLDLVDRGWLFYTRGAALRMTGDMAGALDDLMTARTLFRLVGRRDLRAEVGNLVGLVRFRLRRFEEAEELFLDAVEMNKSLGLTRRVADNLQNLGLTCYKTGRYDRARKLFQEIMGTRHLSADRICRARIALGKLDVLQRRFADARSNLMAAYTLAVEQHKPREECLALEYLGDVFREEGRPAEARRYYARAMVIARKIAPEGDLMLELLRREGECLSTLDRFPQAEVLLGQAMALARRQRDPFELGVTQRCRAELLARQGCLIEGIAAMEAAVSVLSGIRADHELALAHLTAAALYVDAAGDPGIAAEIVDRDTSSGPSAEPAAPVVQVMVTRARRHAVAAEFLFQRVGEPYWERRAGQLLAVVDGHGRRGGGREPGRSPADVDPRAMVVVSRAMRRIMSRCDMYAPYTDPVLVTGETGTGKELICRRLHDASPRRAGPFVPVNCAAIPADLFEREFFGHARGAYTGAESEAPGFVAQAEGGTLFLDEIGDLPLHLQAKLLRLIEYREYRRLGDPRERTADVRLVAATNTCLTDLVEEGRFRKDLYYRLRMMTIDVPPLRERREDIQPLLDLFLTRMTGRATSAADIFLPARLESIASSRLEGNVRELMQIARDGLLQHGRTDRAAAPPSRGDPDAGAHGRRNGRPSSDELHRLLDSCGGNKTALAKSLAVSRSTLYRWMSGLS